MLEALTESAEEVVDLKVHDKLGWTLIGFKSGRVVCQFDPQSSFTFTSSAAAASSELKSVLFVDHHADSSTTTLLAVCARHVCWIDIKQQDGGNITTATSTNTMARVKLEQLDEGAFLTGAAVQLRIPGTEQDDQQHLVLGTNLGQLLLYSLTHRAVVSWAATSSSMALHKRPISAMVVVAAAAAKGGANTTTTTTLVTGCLGGAFLSVWSVEREAGRQPPNNNRLVLNHVRRIGLMSGVGKTPTPCDVLVLQCSSSSSSNLLLACTLPHSTLVWELLGEAASGERLVHRLAGRAEVPLTTTTSRHFPAGAVVVVQRGRLVCGLPRALARRQAAALENGIIGSSSSTAATSPPSSPPSLPASSFRMSSSGSKSIGGGGGDDAILPLRVLAGSSGSPIVRFWQCPGGGFLVQCEDHALLRVAGGGGRAALSSPFARPFHVGGDGGDALMMAGLPIARLHPVLHATAAEFAREKERVMRAVEASDSAIWGEGVETVLWPGRATLQLVPSASSPPMLVLVRWRETQHVAVVSVAGKGSEVRTVLARSGCSAAAALDQQDSQLLVLLTVEKKRRLRGREESSTSSASSSSSPKPPDHQSMFRRGSVMALNPNMAASLRKRLSLPSNASAAAAAATGAASSTADKASSSPVVSSVSVLVVHRVSLSSTTTTTTTEEIDLPLGGDQEVDDVLVCAQETPALAVLALRTTSASTRFFQLHLSDAAAAGQAQSGKLVVIPSSPTLPRHELIAAWRHGKGTTLAVTCEGLLGHILILDVLLTAVAVVRLRCHVLVSAASSASVTSMHWHVGSLFFTTTSPAGVHVAFVGPPSSSSSNKALTSWLLSASSSSSCGVVGRVQRDELVLLDADTGAELPSRVVSLGSALVKAGMLASAGFAQSALQWALTLPNQQLKDRAVALLERLGYARFACDVEGANPVLLLDVMIQHHEDCRDKALTVFHWSSEDFKRLVGGEQQGTRRRRENTLTDCERLGLLFASMKRADAVHWLAQALPSGSEARKFCDGLVKSVNKQQQQQQQQTAGGVE